MIWLAHQETLERRVHDLREKVLRLQFDLQHSSENLRAVRALTMTYQDKQIWHSRNLELNKRRWEASKVVPLLSPPRWVHPLDGLNEDVEFKDAKVHKSYLQSLEGLVQTSRAHLDEAQRMLETHRTSLRVAREDVKAQREGIATTMDDWRKWFEYASTYAETLKL